MRDAAQKRFCCPATSQRIVFQRLASRTGAVPAQAGTQYTLRYFNSFSSHSYWIPACAGMTIRVGSNPSW
jgi:hypothetical protein